MVGSDEDESEVHSTDSERSEFDEITIAPIKNSYKRKSDEKKTSEAKKRRRIIVMSSDSE